MRQTRMLSALIILILLLSAPHARAAFVPATLSYQGSFTNTDGSPFTGVKDITFKLYTAAAGGDAFWTEVQKSVHIVNGRFATVLGNTTVLSPASFSTDVWLGIQVTGDTEMAPRQKLTSVAFALKAENGVPVGGIIMWSGAITDIPTGWAICNGQNGTPDLRGRFVLGAGQGTGLTPRTAGEAGGYETHMLSENEMPKHSHSFSFVNNGFPDNWGRRDTTFQNGHFIVRPDSWGNPATYSTTEKGSSVAHNNMPPYYVLAYIMRIN